MAGLDKRSMVRLDGRVRLAVRNVVRPVGELNYRRDAEAGAGENQDNSESDLNF